jgi:hypothetical protein
MACARHTSLPLVEGMRSVACREQWLQRIAQH